MNKVRSNLEDVISRTFHIRTTVDNGTGVFIELDNRQYVVTAKHLVATIADSVLESKEPAGQRGDYVPCSEVSLDPK